jgi:hypothetical protein
LSAITLALVAAAFLGSTTSSAQDQDFVWARGFGGGYDELGYSVAADLNGNVYTAGQFEGTVDFDPGPGSFPLTVGSGTWPYNPDIFVTKLDAAGHLVWAKQLGGFDPERYGLMALDAGGNVYVTGLFQHAMDVDPDQNAVTTLTGMNGWDVFVVKLDTNGQLVWARSIAGWADEYVTAIAVDASGAVTITGTFSFTMDFDSDPASSFVMTPIGDNDVFVLKLGPDGRFLWARRVGGLGYDIGTGVAFGPDGSVYTTGYFTTTTDFDPGPGVFELPAYLNHSSMFVLKLDAAGQFVWARGYGGPDGYADGRAVLTLDDGTVYVTGVFSGTIDTDPDPASTLMLTSTGDSDELVTRFDAAGGLTWIEKIGGTGTEDAIAMAVDRSGNVYTVGMFGGGGTSDFDPGPGVVTFTGGFFRNGYVLKLDPTGSFVWVKSLGGGSDDRAFGVAVDASGNVYATGFFSTTADFVSGPGISTLTTAGSTDVFTVKMSQTPQMTFDDHATARWSRSFGESGYNVYRSDGVMPGTFACLGSHKSAPFFEDMDSPVEGALYAYLVTTLVPGQPEGTLGFEAVGGVPTTERPNTDPCP